MYIETALGFMFVRGTSNSRTRQAGRTYVCVYFHFSHRVALNYHRDALREDFVYNFAFAMPVVL